MKDVFRSLKLVFSRPKSVILAVSVAVGFYLLNVIILNYSSLISVLNSLGFTSTVRIFYFMSLGFYKSIELYSFITLVISSIFIGTLVSLISYKVFHVQNSTNKKVGIFASIGIFLAALAPGCAVCGIGLVSVLGLSAAFINFFPLKGLEVSIIAVLILVFVNLKVAKDLLVCKTSGFKLKKMKGGK